ncbi:MAG: PD40 domain-containing protein [Elusimicrobia bacterium]|nr:PD40 domain-containing protein [Elusimicrobiota bacterium]
MLTRSYPYRVWETEHFRIHYYDDNPLLLEETARILESAYQDVTADLDAKPNQKLPFFLYTNHNEFEQTRIVDIGEGTGGVTEAFKDRFLIFNNGSLAWLRHVIYHEFTHEVQFAVLNAGFWKSARLLKSILYPLWLMEGLAEYEAGEIDHATDLMYARDAATSRVSPAFKLRDLHNFNHLKPNQITKAYKQGGIMMEFIAREYGKEKLGQILKSYRDRFDPGSVFMDVLGTDDDRFDRNFREWLEETYGEPAKHLDEPSRYGERLTDSEKPIPIFHHSPVISPDGRDLFYIAMRKGYPAVYRKNLTNGKKEILAGGHFRHLDWIAPDERNLAVSADGRRLYFVGEKNNKEYLCRYDLEKNKFKKIALTGLAALKSPTVNPRDGDEIILAGMENGFFDLYKVSFNQAKILERITSDPQDDDYPAYANDGEAIVYSSEVGISSSGMANRDLFLWDSGKKIPERLTRGSKIEKAPAISPDGRRVLFISDEDGAWDLYELDRTSRRVERKTKMITSALAPSFTQGGEAIVFSSFRDGEIHVYRGERSRFHVQDATSLFLDQPVSASRASTSPVYMDFKGGPRRQFGTDLFFPAFFFSTQGGLFTLAYWQASDILGYHNLGTNVVFNSGAGLLDYGVGYTFSRFRPDLYVFFKGSQYRDPFLVSDKGEDLRKKEHLQAMVASYPLDKVHRLETGFEVLQRYHAFPTDIKAINNTQDFRLLAQFVRDTTTAPYLVVTRGSRLAVGAKKSTPQGGFDLQYLTNYLEWHQFFPLGSDSTLASRTLYLRSRGRQFETFPLNGQGGVRGYPRESEAARQRGVAVNNIELRFPLFGDLNYHMWYMFPDFYFKSIYLGLFSDQGVHWNDRTEDFLNNWNSRKEKDFRHSAGVSLKINTFILQTFPFFFNLEWAKRTTKGGGILYGSIFQYFLF